MIEDDFCSVGDGSCSQPEQSVPVACRCGSNQTGPGNLDTPQQHERPTVWCKMVYEMIEPDFMPHRRTGIIQRSCVVSPGSRLELVAGVVLRGALGF